MQRDSAEQLLIKDRQQKRSLLERLQHLEEELQEAKVVSKYQSEVIKEKVSETQKLCKEVAKFKEIAQDQEKL